MTNLKSTRKICFILGLFLSTSLFGQGYDIRLKLKNTPEKTFHLFTYNATNDKVIPIDTSTLNKNSELIFNGENMLSRGMYVLTDTNNHKIFDFIIGDEQHFKIKADLKKMNSSVRVEDSPNNKIFFDFLKYNEKERSELSEKDKKDPQKLMETNARIKAFQHKLVEEHPNLFVSKFFKATHEPKNPYTSAKDSIQSYYYYKNHYWDNLDLADTGLLHTPFFKSKMEFYFNKVVSQIPDSIIQVIDEVISKTPPRSSIRDYMLYDLLGEYQNHQIMGFDKVFIHLGEKYFLNHQVKNFPESSREQFQEAVDKAKPLLLGKTGANMILIDTANNLIPLYSIKKPYTVLFFYDYDCSHCKKDMKKLKELYLAGLNKKIEVYAVCTNSDLEKWKAYIKKNNWPWINVNGTHSALGNFNTLYNVESTPLIYVLDKNKKIIAKKIASDQIQQIIDFKEIK